MESPKIESTGEGKKSLSNYFPPIADLGKRSAVYATTSVLTGRINPVIITSSLFNAVTVSFAKQISDAESNSTKELIVTIISLAGSTLALSFVAAPLLGCITDVSVGTMLTLGFFNAIGEAALQYVVPYIMGKISTPKLPGSIDDVKALSKDGVIYIRDHFEDYKEMFKNEEVMNAFTGRLAEVEAFPELPKTVKEIEDMNVFAVHYAFTNYRDFDGHFEGLEDVDYDDMMKALHARFYQQDLPLPNGQTVFQIIDDDMDRPLVTVEVPKSTKDVQDLSANQLAWVYFGIDYNPVKLMRSMPIAIQVELNQRFLQMLDIDLYYIPTLENIKEISPEHVKVLYDKFSSMKEFDLYHFKTFPSDLKTALNAKFKAHSDCAELEQDYAALNAKPLNPAENVYHQPLIQTYHRFYSNNPQAWNALEKEEQETWNKLFNAKEIERSSLPLKD